MKKKILGVLMVAAITLAAGVNVIQSNNDQAELSDLALTNVEALANNEGSGVSCRHNTRNPDEICNIYADGNYCPCGF